MKQSFYTILFLFFHIAIFGQVRVIDIGFGAWNRVNSAAAIFDQIEAGNTTNAFAYLDIESQMDFDELDAQHQYLGIFYKYSEFGKPPSVIKEDIDNEYYFYERHYYLLEHGTVIYLGQLIATINKSTETSDNILKVELRKGDNAIDRDMEILSIEDHSWSEKLESFKTPDEKSDKVRVDFDVNDYSRKLETTYVNTEYNFGFDYDSTLWKLDVPFRIVSELRLKRSPFIEWDLLRKADGDQPYPAIMIGTSVLQQKLYYLSTIKDECEAISFDDDINEIYSQLETLGEMELALDLDRNMLISKRKGVHKETKLHIIDVMLKDELRLYHLTLLSETFEKDELEAFVDIVKTALYQ